MDKFIKILRAKNVWQASAVVAPIRSAGQLVATGGSDGVENKEGD